MYGWRARVGLIIPADNTVMEPELYGLDLPGISFHVARLTTWKRDEMPACGISLAPLFREMGVDAVVYACAETSFLGGVDANRVIIDQIQQASGLPTITATWAMVEALRAMSLTRIGLVTPYTAPRGAVMEEFLGRNGITVAASHHHDFHPGSDDPREWYPTNIQPPHVVYRLVRALPREGIEGYLLSATNFRTLDVVDQLERDLGVPVVSCNQSIIWWSPPGSRARWSGPRPRPPPRGRLMPDLSGRCAFVPLRAAAWAQPSPSVLARADEVIQ